MNKFIKISLTGQYFKKFELSVFVQLVMDKYKAFYLDAKKIAVLKMAGCNLMAKNYNLQLERIFIKLLLGKHIDV